MNNYTMEDFTKQFNVAKEQLSNVCEGRYSYINNYKYILLFTERASNVLGRCRRITNDTYYIYLNKLYADNVCESDVNNVIMHELCHSIKGGMCHTGEWKKAVNLVNNIYGYNISRTTKTNEYAGVRNELNPYKYEVYCTNCGKTCKYRKMCKTVKTIAHTDDNFYYCTNCNKRHTLKVRDLTNNKELYITI